MDNMQAIQALRDAHGSVVTTKQIQEFGAKHSLPDLYSGIKAFFPRAGHGSYSLDGSVPKAEITAPKSKKDIIKMIEAKFGALDTLAEGVVAGNIRSLIVSGAPGVGKTYTLDKHFNKAHTEDRISIAEYGGTVSAIGLYELLYNNRDAGQVIKLDDMDSVFQDDESLNILKHALDSGDTRRISWLKNSRFLEEKGIPNTFEYEGQIVFITNMNFEQIIEKGGRLAVHLDALMSRSVYLDLSIHSKEEILVRVEQVMMTSEFRRKVKLDVNQLGVLLDWLTNNMNKLRSLSMRTVLQAASFMKSSKDWESIASMTLLKQR